MAEPLREPSPPTKPPAEWLGLVRAAEKSGDHLRAYDLALRGLHEHKTDPGLRYRAVLTIARAGGLSQARAHIREFGFSPASDDEDVACLEPRLVKDEALAASGPDRIGFARRSAEMYQSVFERTRGYYPGINAATMRLLVGDRDQSRSLAARVLELVRDTPPTLPDAFWRLATAAEAALLLADFSAAEAYAAKAATAADIDGTMRATTWKQLRWVAGMVAAPPALLRALKPPTVIHYSGHRIAAPGVSGRFAAASEAEVATAIAAHLAAREVGYGFGSLASGADILFAEALLARGAQLHVVLPFDAADFKAVSVMDSGPQWVARFERCLAGAAGRVSYATEGAYLGRPRIFTYAARYAMGLAAMQARALETDLEQVVVWDRQKSEGDAGTGADVEFWRSLALPAHVIDCGARSEGAPPPTSTEPAPRTPERVIRAMLFGDVKGFSKLNDSQIPDFLDHIMGRIGAAMKRHDDAILYRNTWGDGLYVVLKDASDAARCALDIQRAMEAIDFSTLDLPDTLALRIGAHLGPVYERADPVLDTPGFFGAHVSRTARIEPVTPPGKVYVSEPFAARLALEDPAAGFEYVGVVPAAKGYGEMRMFLLKTDDRAPEQRRAGRADP